MVAGEDRPETTTLRLRKISMPQAVLMEIRGVDAVQEAQAVDTSIANIEGG
jgi:hypothetical protein